MMNQEDVFSANAPGYPGTVGDICINIPAANGSWIHVTTKNCSRDHHLIFGESAGGVHSYQSVNEGVVTGIPKNYLGNK